MKWESDIVLGDQLPSCATIADIVINHHIIHQHACETSQQAAIWATKDTISHDSIYMGDNKAHK